MGKLYKAGKPPVNVSDSQDQYYLSAGYSYNDPSASTALNNVQQTSQNGVTNNPPSASVVNNSPQGGTAPSWNSGTRLVYSSNGNPKEIPANEYDNYISKGWGATPPNQNNQNQNNMQNAGSYQENTNTPNTPNIPDTGDKNFNELLRIHQAYLDGLAERGQTINPNIEITPEQTAQFLTQAQSEISPYYSTQMKLAREGLLRDAGYTSDEIAQSEAETEKKYGQNLRTLGSNAAESGMALSGGRQLDEQNLAEDTQSAIDQNRKLQEYNMGNKARTFAGEWGGGELPSFSYSSAPKVTAGVGSFGRTLDTKPFYNISDSVYDGLKGSKQYDQEVAQRTRASELEQAFRQKEENKARTLTL